MRTSRGAILSIKHVHTICMSVMYNIGQQDVQRAVHDMHDKVVAIHYPFINVKPTLTV